VSVTATTPNANVGANATAGMKKPPKSPGIKLSPEAITNINGLITNIGAKTGIYASFKTELTGWLAAGTMNCGGAGALAELIGNMKELPKDSTYSKQLKALSQKPKTTCRADTLFTVSANQLNCVGCGDSQSLFPINFTLNAQAKISANYYFAMGCFAADNTYFYYGSYGDKAETTTMTDFMYTKGSTTMDLNAKCMEKGKNCVPGSTTQGPECQSATLKGGCKSDLDSECKRTGLADTITKMAASSSSAYPNDCDADKWSLDENSDEFIKKCFGFIGKRFLRRSILLNPTAIQEIDAQITGSIIATTLRMLDDTDGDYATVSSDTTEDPYAGQTLNDNDVTVDGSTSSAAGSTASSMSDFNTGNGSNNLVFSIFSVSLLLLLAIFN